MRKLSFVVTAIVVVDEIRDMRMKSRQLLEPGSDEKPMLPGHQ